MKIVKFLGGLGNQMFQYALYKALEKRNKVVKADVTEFSTYTTHDYEIEEVFDIKLNKASRSEAKLYQPFVRDWFTRKLRKFKGLKNAYTEETTPFCFDEDVLTARGPKFYWGYWQNQDYFIDIETQIRQDFQFSKTLDPVNKDLLTQMVNSNSISIHVRRGNYLDHELLGGICDLEYYKKAIDFITNKVDQPVFFIFSNDIDWCKKNLDINFPKTFVSGNNGPKNYIDMQLMSHCKHNIIANSSFSWWGAWLNENPEKIVVSPKKWVNNNSPNSIIPSAWTKI